MLDIVLLRKDQGGNPDLVRESQRRRYADAGLVDQVIGYDEEWRQSVLRTRPPLRHAPDAADRGPGSRAARGALDLAKKDKNAVQKKIGEFMKKKETPPDELLAEKKAAEAKIAELEAKEKELIATRDQTLGQIGACPGSDATSNRESACAARERSPTASVCWRLQATLCRTMCRWTTTRTTTGSRRRGASSSAKTGCSRTMT